MAIRITGTGSALPANRVTNDDLAKFMDTSDEWIAERTGIRSRYISTNETVADLAASACKKALENGNTSPEEIDLLMVATCSPEDYLPCIACQVQARLEMKHAVAFDLNAACSGFLFALNTAYAYLKSGIYKKAMIVGAEVLSKIVDWQDRGTCILFGDGAGACIVETKGEKGGILGFAQHSDGSKGSVLSCNARKLINPYCQEEDEEGYVKMDGREVFGFATRQVPLVLKEAIENAGLTPAQIDYFVLHQANSRIIECVSKRIGEPMDKFPMNIDRVGNMSSASLPVLLDELNKEDRLKPGMKIALAGFGEGLTDGGCVMEW